MSIQASVVATEGFARRRIAMAVSAALAAAIAIPLNAHAQNAPTQTAGEPKTLPKISVEGEDEPTPKVDRVSSPKFTQELVNTPQTIAVISNQVLTQQGATSLSQALRNTPA